jgi:hypothetical protein
VEAHDWLLVALLVFDGAQLGAALAAWSLSRRRRRADDPVLARYSRDHGLLLAAGAVLLAIPLVLGLAGVVAARTAVWIVLAAEVAGALAARELLDRMDRRAAG